MSSGPEHGSLTNSGSALREDSSPVRSLILRKKVLHDPYVKDKSGIPE